MKSDICSKLNAREYERIEFHGVPLSTDADYMELPPSQRPLGMVFCHTGYSLCLL